MAKLSNICQIYIFVSLLVIFSIIFFSTQLRTETVKIIYSMIGENKHHGVVPLKGKSPWLDVPYFELYIRMNSKSRFITEYQQWFLKGYRLYFPPDRQTKSLVIGFDDENPIDHEVGDILRTAWPFPRIYFHEKYKDQSIYQNRERYRSFYDQFYPEKYIQSKFVGYVDSDTMFSSVVTPNSLFDKGRPIIIGRVGDPTMAWWPKGTDYILGYKEVAQFMFYFPVVVQVNHVVELRHFIAKRFGKSFEEVFAEAYRRIGFDAPCQFNVICNYLWYHHRDEYSFRFQLSYDRYTDDRRQEGMIPLLKLKRETRRLPTSWLPIPRVAIHARHLRTPSGAWIGLGVDNPLAIPELRKILKGSFCYVYGLDFCKTYCKNYNNSVVYHYFYQFDNFVWTWDKRCYEEQQRYINETRKIVQYYKKTIYQAFGFDATTDICLNVENFINHTIEVTKPKIP